MPPNPVGACPAGDPSRPTKTSRAGLAPTKTGNPKLFLPDNPSPTSHINILAHERFVTAVDQNRIDFCIADNSLPPGDSVQPVACDSSAGFNLHGMQPAVAFPDQVDFVSNMVAPEIKLRRFSGIEAGLEHLRDHQCFKQCAAQWMGIQGFSIANAQQPDRQTDIDKIKLRPLDQPLPEIAEI